MLENCGEMNVNLIDSRPNCPTAITCYNTIILKKIRDT